MRSNQLQTMKSPTLPNARTYAESGHHYCFTLTAHGWRNQGMVPDNNRAPFVTDYKSREGTSRVAFVPFCFTGKANMTDSEIYSFATHSE